MTQIALISPQETRYYQTGWYNGKAVMDGVGCRVAQVVPNGSEFPVAEPLYWLDCADEIEPETYVFNLEDNNFYLAMWEPVQPEVSGTIETL